MEKIPKPNFSSITLKDDLRGLDLGEEEKIWKEVACSEARMALMKSMINQNLAFADLEDFGLEFTNKMKAVNVKNKTLVRNITKPAMKA